MESKDSKKWIAGELLARREARLGDVGDDATWLEEEEAALVGELGADDEEEEMEPEKLRRMLGEAPRGAAVAPRPYPHLFGEAEGARFRLDDEPRGMAKEDSAEEESSADLDAAVEDMDRRRRHLESLFAYRGPASISKDAARARAMASGQVVDGEWERLWDEMSDREERSLLQPPSPWTHGGAEDGALHPIDEFAEREARAMDPGSVGDADGDGAARPDPDPDPDPDPVGRFEAAWDELKRWIGSGKR